MNAFSYRIPIIFSICAQYIVLRHSYYIHYSNKESCGLASVTLTLFYEEKRLLQSHGLILISGRGELLINVIFFQRTSNECTVIKIQIFIIVRK